MNLSEEALSLVALTDIPAAGVCRFDAVPVVPGVRSASRLPSAAKSVIVCLFPYYTGGFPRRNLSLYAVIPDYHAVAGRMLSKACGLLSKRFPGEAFIPFVDASPLDEVTAAERAGLGRRGKNGQLLHPEYGSFVFIGEIVTTLELEPTDTEQDPLCTGCGACLAACPTGALGEKGFQRELCRSHLTQKKGMLTDWERREIAAGGLVWGCDLCTLACPYNRRPVMTPIGAFLAGTEPIVTTENLRRLLENRAFAYRGRAVLQRNLNILSEYADNLKERGGRHL